MTTETDRAEFNDTGIIKDIPPKDDVKLEKAAMDEMDKIQRDRTKEAIRVAMGEKPDEPKPEGTLTKDVPQLIFRIGSEWIGCPKFNLDDGEAETMSKHLNILLPVSGKVASLVIVIMITLNKVYTCIEPIKAKFAPRRKDEQPQPATLPEPIS